MGETIGESVKSILSQVDDRFEVVIVDDGSTDQSVSVLRDLVDREERLRVLELPRCRNRKLGATRNISIHAADGDYVIIHLDADDSFQSGILDVVDVFERIDNHIDHNFYFMSCGFGIAKREFLLNYGPYRNLPVGGEDQDMWRRMFADDAVIWVESKNLSEEIGYEKGRTALARRWFKIAVSNFQTGISYGSYLNWSRENRSKFGFLYDLCICAPLAYIISLTRDSYDLPSEYKRKGAIDEHIAEQTKTIAELEEEYGFKLDRGSLSTRAKKLYEL